MPERPAEPLDIVGAAGGRPLRGHLSGLRSTHDARVRISGNRESAYRLFATRPEIFPGHFGGHRSFADGGRLGLDPDAFHASTADGAVTDHVTLCDPYLAAGPAKNPYACVHAGRPADCYDVTVLEVVHGEASEPGGLRSQLWSTPVTITVSGPKTAEAGIAKIELRGPPVRSPMRRAPRRSGSALLEPVVSGDGRLLVMNSGDTLVYSVMSGAATPCDARGWKRLAHVSEMHRDRAMKRYGVARYPLRDSENRRVRAGKPLRGAYPWIDRDGKNLFFTQVGGLGLFYRDRDGEVRARLELVDEPRRRDIEIGGATRLAMSFFGLWSQGKVVIPDTRVNNIDFHVGPEDYRPRARLYRDDPGGVALAHGLISKINSAENQWNYLPTVLPRSPRDVVWWLSGNNRMTGEVVFDDALDLGALIYSPMNAAVDNKRKRWRDGFDYKRLGGYSKTPRLQNAAASELRWKLPSHGRLVGGRIEPVAAGGVVGKGLWLDGERTRLEYAIPSQNRDVLRAETWTTTLWVDSRATGSRRRLLSFPDGSWVDLGSGRVVVGADGRPEAVIDLPPALELRRRVWTHLGFVSRPGAVDLYVQGFKLVGVAGDYLRPEPGMLVVGRPAESARPGFHGWIDELRVVSGRRDPETLCNWAGGTLRGLAEETDAVAWAAAGVYPDASHEEVRARLASSSGPTWRRYACERDRGAAPGCLDAIQRPGAGPAACVRPALLFPEGPLYHDRPRPDSRANDFCRTCHANGHPTASLRIGKPLRGGPEGSTLAEDRRRQPAQAPRRLHGFLPQGLLGLAEAVEAPPEGLLLDPRLYPGAGDAGGSAAGR